MDRDKIKEKIIEMLIEYDKNYLEYEKILKKYKKIEIIKSELFRIYKNGYLFDENIKEEEKLIELENLLKEKKLKFYFTNLSLTQIIPIFDNIEISENYLRESINKTKNKKENPSKLIVWKSCREIKQFTEKSLIILPKALDYSNFKQGHFGDCYFISCIRALSLIPQLLNIILRLNTNEQENRISKDVPYFTVTFFIDGEWKIIKVKNSFPVYEKTGELVGVKPKSNEIFLMILEKAWALINGGYDKIEGGRTKYIFELFLGCKCDEFKKYNFNINSLYNSIQKNEQFFGALSICGSKTYKINKEIDKDNFDKKKAIEEGFISKKGGHAYTILKTLEINKKKNNVLNDTCKFLIISNPHGENSNIIKTGIEKKRIKEILEEEFGKENEEQYQFILKYNDNYDKGTGIIYMPLEYYKDWADNTSICYCHYDCISYTNNINNKLECLYIYKIKLNDRQFFSCQILLPSLRAHDYEMNKINIKLKRDDKEIISINIRLYYCLYGIKIIKNDENLNFVENSFSDIKENNFSCIREVNTILEKGEYFIFTYLESSLEKNSIRFLCEKKIEVNLMNIIDKEELENKYELKTNDKIDSIFVKHNQELYKKFLARNNSKVLNSHLDFKKEVFLPGVKQCYLHFKELINELNNLSNKGRDLSPNDAIYSISPEGDSYTYDILDPNSMNKIFSENLKDKKDDNKNIRQYIKNVQTMQFIDNLGYPYNVKNFEELINEIKINKNPLCCLFSEYDENTSTIKSSVIYFKLYYNKAMNEDILVVSDKTSDAKGYLKRELNPLFIIILDISESMKNYYNLLQNQIIPQLLRKLNYFSSEGEEYMKDFDKKKISNYDLLNAISSEIRRNNFLKRYDLDIEKFKKLCQNIAILITFSDDSKIYFFDSRQFDTCNFKGIDTFFIQAAENLEKILNSISRERSIRMLTFTDEDISDPTESKKKLDEILNSPKIKHQMNSVTVRVCHDTIPDTEILMKLSKFSHPPTDNKPIVIYPEKESLDEMIEKIYIQFKDDDMIYNLKLISEIKMMTNDFSENFSNEAYYKEKNPIRFKNIDSENKLKNKSDYYENLLGNSPVEIQIENVEDLNESNFYDLMSKSAFMITKNILENKINQKTNSKDNEDIIYYFEQTEKSFQNSREKKLYELLKEINENDNISQMDSKKLFEYINEMEKQTTKIIEGYKKSIINNNFKNTLTSLFKEKKDNTNINLNNNLQKIKKIFNYTFIEKYNWNNITKDSYSPSLLDNSFCLFKSINDKLYLIYSTASRELIFYNINKKKIEERIQKAHERPITNIRHYSSTKNDYILTISATNRNIKLWNFEAHAEILQFNPYKKGFIYSACFLNNIHKKYIITSNFINNGNSDDDRNIEVYDFKNKKIKKIKVSSNKTYFIDSFYDNNSNINYIITANEGILYSYNFDVAELFNEYYDSNQDSENISYRSALINESNDIIHLIASNEDGYIRIWNFQTSDLLNKISLNSNLYGICLWDKDNLLIGCGDKDINVLDISDVENLYIKNKTLNGHNNRVITIKKVKNILVSQGWKQDQIKLWTFKNNYFN